MTTRTERLETALRTILDAVDYTAGACRLNEMVGAILPRPVIEMAKAALACDGDKSAVGAIDRESR